MVPLVCVGKRQHVSLLKRLFLLPVFTAHYQEAEILLHQDSAAACNNLWVCYSVRQGNAF